MFTWKKTLIYFVILWIYSIGFLSLPLLEIWGDFKYYDGTFSCTFDNKVPVKNLFIGIGYSISLMVLISSAVAINRFMTWSTESCAFCLIVWPLRLGSHLHLNALQCLCLHKNNEIWCYRELDMRQCQHQGTICFHSQQTWSHRIHRQF